MRRILSGEAVVAGASAIDLSCCQMLVPALIWYEETAGNHAVRNHLQEQLTKRLEARNVDLSRIGPLILLTTSEVELWEELARSVSAEELIHEYVQLVKRFPRDPASVFQAFAHVKFHGQNRPTGFMPEKVESLITGIQSEHLRRSKAENEHR